jgi:hypothetical protein
VFNLIKNKLLIALICVFSLILFDVGWSAPNPITLTSTTRTATTETQASGITKVSYATTIRWDFDTLAAANGAYADTNTTVPLLIPSTSLSGVTSWSAAAWIYTSGGTTGDFSDSIGSTTGDTCEIVWEYSMDGNKWYTTDLPATKYPQESRMMTQVPSTATGSNFVAFGPINRFGDRSAIMDSTSALRSVDAQIWPVAQYVRGRVYIHGFYSPGVPPTGRYATVNFKAFILLKKE